MIQVQRLSSPFFYTTKEAAQGQKQILKMKVCKALPQNEATEPKIGIIRKGVIISP